QDAIDDMLGGSPDPTAAVGDTGDEFAPGAGRNSGSATGGGNGATAGRSTGYTRGQSTARSSESGTTGQARPVFHTYVTVSPDDEPGDPEGLGSEERLQVEAIAIDFILAREPALQRTARNNPGFDLFEGK